MVRIFTPRNLATTVALTGPVASPAKVPEKLVPEAERLVRPAPFPVKTPAAEMLASAPKLSCHS